MKTEQQLQLVSYQQAKRLKTLGFDWEYDMCYNTSGLEKEIGKLQHSEFYGYQNYNALSTKISAPTVALALKWARDVKGIHFDIKRKWSKIHDNYVFVIIKEMYDHVSDTYEQAESALLDEILNLLANG